MCVCVAVCVVLVTWQGCEIELSRGGGLLRGESQAGSQAGSSSSGGGGGEEIC